MLSTDHIIMLFSLYLALTRPMHCTLELRLSQFFLKISLVFLVRSYFTRNSLLKTFNCWQSLPWTYYHRYNFALFFGGYLQKIQFFNDIRLLSKTPINANNRFNRIFWSVIIAKTDWFYRCRGDSPFNLFQSNLPIMLYCPWYNKRHNPSLNWNDSSMQLYHFD